ncbi:hypothetical protein [Fundidesulfovibrio soli]|uniref:hypothetical protein n=1 Tax=Fundidesulfovibrio soli TaxID=2922716 RepID=UPI001FAFFAA1|nr:hypothetical protein [Fundidesulfovibrio soli]
MSDKESVLEELRRRYRELAENALDGSFTEAERDGFDRQASNLLYQERRYVQAQFNGKEKELADIAAEVGKIEGEISKANEKMKKISDVLSNVALAIVLIGKALDKVLV